MKRQSQNKRRLLLGLTGSFGSGKSTVAGIFRSFGARVIDADKIARAYLKPGTTVYRRLIAGFGKGIIKDDGAIDRKRLGEIVFADKRALRKLNKITHPWVIREIKRQLKGQKTGVIVLDTPLFIEAGLRKMADKLLVVRASRENQIKRAVKKTGLSRAQALRRIKSQIPISLKVRMADFVIDNDLTLKNTRNQVRRIRRQLWRN